MDGRQTPHEKIPTMKSILSNDYVAITARIFIGFLFVFASVDKVADPGAFSASIMNYKLLSPMLASLIATVLPWAELLSGFAIIVGVFQRGSALLLTSLLVIFTVAVLSALLRGLDITCGCFTQDPRVGKIGWLKIIENTGLILLTSFLFYSTSAKFTVAEYIAKKVVGGR
jgi:uncharacterized membrane protein YphA (DoxX/SURF4 family)